MKKLLASLLFLAAVVSKAEPAHPRLFVTDGDIATIKKEASANPLGHIAAMNKVIIADADACMKLDDSKLLYKKDASGRRILHICGEALHRATFCAYAYRVTGERRYCDYALHVLDIVCKFPDWNTSHFLDPSEMSLCVGVTYDWLYDQMSAQQREMVRKALVEFAIKPALSFKPNGGFYGADNNWNSVCNCGILAGALAIFDKDEPLAAQVISRIPASNRPAMKVSYSPDGNYPEGVGYWGYGTTFQVLMLTIMESVLGTDYGLSDTPGFKDTPKYIQYGYGVSGYAFNYSDCGMSKGIEDAMWYFADRFNDPTLPYKEVQALSDGSYRPGRTSALFMGKLAKSAGITPKHPSETYYCAHGGNSVAVVRTGWDAGAEDKYLGIKAGSPSFNHAHMDAGSFVYEAYGVRWSYDPPYPAYAFSEVELGKLHKNLWDMSQNSARWQLLSYNNFSHSTITVNDALYVVKGKSKIVKELNSPASYGAVLDMTEVLGLEQVAKATRTIELVENRDLVVTDEITAPEGKEVRLRWNFTTKASVQVAKKGIKLTSDGVTMKLSTTSTGAKPQYYVKAANPANFDFLMRNAEPEMKGCCFCGYETVIPAGTTVSLRTVLTKVR